MICSSFYIHIQYYIIDTDIIGRDLTKEITILNYIKCRVQLIRW